MGDKRFSPIPKQTKLEKIGYRRISTNMWETRVGDSGPCNLQNFIAPKKCMKIPFKNASTLHTCSFGTIGKSFVQQCNDKTVTLTCPAPPVPLQQWLVRD